MNGLNLNGGLTLIPMPGFEEQTERVKPIIEGKTRDEHRLTPVDIVRPEFGRRASGEPYIRMAKEHIGGHDCVVITSGPGTPGMLINLFLLLGYLVARKARRISIVSGYLPLTRSDKDEGELELAILPLIIHLMDSTTYNSNCRLDRVVACDLHAAQEVSICRMGLITEVSLIGRLLKRVIELAGKVYPGLKICLFFTDEGSVKRYEEPVKQVCSEMDIELPMVAGRKRRLSSRSSNLVGLDGDVEEVKGALVVGVDDEFATGGTSNKGAAFIKETYGAAVYWAAVVHPVLCGGAPDVLGDEKAAIDRTFAMDTIPTNTRRDLRDLLDSKRLTVFPWDEDLANILFYLHWDKTIRTLR